MNMSSYNIKIQHEVFGVLLAEKFVDATQFKLFLKMVQSSIELKTDLTFFNGVDFLIHIPYKHLVDSIITTDLDIYGLTEHFKAKSKIEALETR